MSTLEPTPPVTSLSEPSTSPSDASETGAGPDFFTRWFILLTFAIVYLSTMLNVSGLGQSEVIDDHVLIHSVDQRGCGLNPLDCFKHPQFGLYNRPLLGVSFSLGERLHGTATVWFKLENLVLHALAVALTIWMFRLLFRNDRAALIAGLLFSLHPLQVPVTTFIGGRTDTMALIFLFLFVIGIIKSVRSPEQEADGQNEAQERQDVAEGGQGTGEGIQGTDQGKQDTAEGNQGAASSAPTEANGGGEEDVYPFIRDVGAPLAAPCMAPHWGWRLLSLLSFTAAVFTKEQSFLLAFLAPLMLPPVPAGQRWRSRRWLLLFVLPVLLYFWSAHHVIPKGAVEAAPWSAALRIEMVGRSLWYYAKVLFFPTVTSLQQVTLGPWDTPQPVVMLLGFFAAGMWLALLVKIWPNRLLRLFALWLTLTLLPCLNIIPIPSQFVASYRAVLPLVGLAGLAGWVLGTLKTQRQGSLARVLKPEFSATPPVRVAETATGPRARDHRSQSLGIPNTLAIFLAGLSLFYIVVSLQNVPVWRNDETFGRAQMAADPNCLPALAVVADYLYNRQRNQEVIALYDEVMVRLMPEAKTEGEILRQARQPWQRRRLQSLSGLRYTMGYILHFCLRERGGARQRLGEYAGAVFDYRIALAFYPDDQEVRTSLAECYLLTGRVDSARDLLERAVRSTPNAYRLARLGDVYAMQGEWALARDMLARFMRAPASDKSGASLNRAHYDQLYRQALAQAGPPPADRKQP